MSDFPKLNTSEQAALLDTAQAVGADPRWLYQLIDFESRWNPQIKNPTSSARGLIQFMDATAKGMGFPGGSAELVSRFPTREAQLAGPVKKYLQQLAPHATEQALYMAVFYPAARKWPLSRQFPAAVQKANPGITSVESYVRKVNPNYSAGGPSLGTWVLIGGAAWWLANELR